MRSIDAIIEMKSASRAARSRGQKIGFVPTMGGLHDGHLSLVRRAKELSDLAVMSVFVNPAQFGEGEDFNFYPRNPVEDAGLAAEAGVDIFFAPDAGAIYTDGFATYVQVEGLSDRLEGAVRRGHFRGVATVVAKLFQIVAPDIAVFGQKDAQQVAVVKRMVRDLDLDVEIIVAPIVREKDGLAMSSRNAYLTPEERKASLVLHRALARAERAVAEGARDPVEVARLAAEEVRAEPLATLDYAEIVSPDDFQPAGAIARGTTLVLAARFGTTRLLDNVILSPREGH